MASTKVPIVQSLAEVYHDDEVGDEVRRWHQVVEQFKSRFGFNPDFVSRSPGRVNIIGEHIDYSLFPVLPMAIRADALVVVGAKEPASEEGKFTIRISNYEKELFPDDEFSEPFSSEIPIEASTHSWTNYFKAGLRGALALLRKTNGDGFRPRNMDVMIHGTVPPAGGLSSSAALVTASALSVLYANGVTEVDKFELTKLAIESERAVGVNSGGMDQSASVMSEKGSALYVEFEPSLSVRHVKFPHTSPELVFMIAQSFVKADKKVSGPFHYNLRVVECTLAALVLLRTLHPSLPSPLPKDDSPLALGLGTIFDSFWKSNSTLPQKTMTSRLTYFLETILPSSLPEASYTKKSIAGILNVDVEFLDTNFIKKRFPVPAESFNLRDRARHVFAETLRVYKFMDLLEKPQLDSITPAQFNQQLGDLLNQSQQSCREDFDCSAESLDRICKIAREAGSLGSRLTGAGWGGATVHLVPVDKVDGVKAALKREYYDKLEGGQRPGEEQLRDAVIVSRPGSGSAVQVLS